VSSGVPVFHTGTSTGTTQSTENTPRYRTSTGTRQVVTGSSTTMITVDNDVFVTTGSIDSIREELNRTEHQLNILETSQKRTLGLIQQQQQQQQQEDDDDRRVNVEVEDTTTAAATVTPKTTIPIDQRLYKLYDDINNLNIIYDLMHNTDYITKTKESNNRSGNGSGSGNGSHTDESESETQSMLTTDDLYRIRIFLSTTISKSKSKSTW
jgi:hypothetical protein